MLPVIVDRNTSETEKCVHVALPKRPSEYDIAERQSEAATRYTQRSR